MNNPGKMTHQEFIAKWQHSELKERSASQSHFNDLCALLGEQTPTDADQAGEWFCFEKGAKKTGGGDGWVSSYEQKRVNSCERPRHGALTQLFF